MPRRSQWCCWFGVQVARLEKLRFCYSTPCYLDLSQGDKEERKEPLWFFVGTLFLQRSRPTHPRSLIMMVSRSARPALSPLHSLQRSSGLIVILALRVGGDWETAQTATWRAETRGSRNDQADRKRPKSEKAQEYLSTKPVQNVPYWHQLAQGKKKRKKERKLF